MMATIKLDGVRKLVLVVFALALTLFAVRLWHGSGCDRPRLRCHGDRVSRL
jgi:hypothetical protein